MKTEDLKKVLSEIAEDRIPSIPAPWAVLRQRFEASNAAQPDKGVFSMKSIFARNRLRVALAGLLVVLALAVFLVATPAGNALAQRILQYFSPAGQSSFPVDNAEIINAAAGEESDNLPTTTPPPGLLVDLDQQCAGQPPAVRYACVAAVAETYVDFPINGIPTDSPVLEYAHLDVDTRDNTVRLYYSYRGYPNTEDSVWLLQGQGEFPTANSDWDKVLPEAVETVQVGAVTGEFVQGGFILRPGATEATWDSDMPFARLRWKVGDTWFEMFKAGQPELVTSMDQAGMIELATHLVRLNP